MLFTDFRRAIHTLWDHNLNGVNPAKMVDVNQPRAIPDVVEGQEARRPGTIAPPKKEEPKPAPEWVPKFEFNDPNLVEKVGRHLAGLNDHDAEQLFDAAAADLAITGSDAASFKRWGRLFRSCWQERSVPVDEYVKAA